MEARRLRSPHEDAMTFPDWHTTVNAGLSAAGLPPLEFRAAAEYFANGYTADEVIDTEAGEAREAEDARMAEAEPYGNEWRYP